MTRQEFGKLAAGCFRGSHDGDHYTTSMYATIEALWEALRGYVEGPRAPDGDSMVYDESCERCCHGTGHHTCDKGRAPEGPWLVTHWLPENGLMEEWVVSMPSSATVRGRYRFASEAEAIAVRDALNRVAAQGGKE